MVADQVAGTRALPGANGSQAAMGIPLGGVLGRRRIPQKVAVALLGVLGILCFVGPDYLSTGIERRLENVAGGTPVMPAPPKLIPGKTFAKCEDEKAYEIARDKYFASLTNETMPRPFPVDVPPLDFVTNEQCEALSDFGKDPAPDGSPRVVVHLEVYKDIPMIKRIIRRLAHERNHAFVVHLADDVNHDVIEQLAEYSARDSPAPLCVVQGGFITYLSSTDIRILFRSMQWLVEDSSGPTWDFFVSLSGADFPIMNGRTFSRELKAAGSKTWFLKEQSRKDPYRTPRFEKYGMTCQETSGEYEVIDGRTFWLKNLVPEIEADKHAPLSSGGIFHREMVEFLVRDDRARAAYMYFRHHNIAGVESYWPTIFTLPELRDKLLPRNSCAMYWAPVGRFRGATANSFMTMDTWDKYIKRAIDNGLPFIRKFDSEKEGKVLDRIEAYADERFGEKQHGEVSLK